MMGASRRACCRPAFVDELQGLAGSDVSACADESCRANLLMPPVAIILAKSQAYEKNVLSLINRYPHLSRVVREREALEVRYEVLRARQSRDGKQRQSKGKDDACAQEPDGIFVRMTVAYDGIRPLHGSLRRGEGR